MATAEKIRDLTATPPMFTTEANDRSGKKWDTGDRTGIAYGKGVTDVEFHRDIKPILARSCVGCHSVKHDKPAGKLALDDDRPIKKRGLVPWAENVQVPQGLPKTYARLVQYAWAFQARRSPLMWMVHGKRLDGFRNEDIPSPPLDYEDEKNVLDWCHHGKRRMYDVDYTGHVMPPPDAVSTALSDGATLALSRGPPPSAPANIFSPQIPSATGEGDLWRKNVVEEVARFSARAWPHF